VVEVDNYVFLAIADDGKEASFLLLFPNISVKIRIVALLDKPGRHF